MPRGHGNERRWTARELRAMQAMRDKGATIPEIQEKFKAGESAVKRGLQEKPTRGRTGARKRYSEVSVKCPTCLVFDGHAGWCSGD